MSAVRKRFDIIEGHSLDYRAEIFNLPNAVNFGDPDGRFGGTTFGRLQDTTPARQIQAGLRYSF